MSKKTLPKEQKRRIAIFDIDGTIFRSSLLIELVKAMIQAGTFPPRVKKIFLPAYRAWLDREGPYEDYIMAVVKAFESNLEGVPKKEMMKMARSVISIHKNRVYRYTSDLTTSLKEKGYYLLAISHSPKEVLEGFCGEWGFDKVYGRIHEADENGMLTGETQYLDLIRDKSKVLRRAVEKEHVTMKGSVGVGDTESDISFLSQVDRPICFNPNKRLYKHAKKNGWSVIVERKDVIYKL